MTEPTNIFIRRGSKPQGVRREAGEEESGEGITTKSLACQATTKVKQEEGDWLLFRSPVMGTGSF